MTQTPHPIDCISFYSGRTATVAAVFLTSCSAWGQFNVSDKGIRHTELETNRWTTNYIGQDRHNFVDSSRKIGQEPADKANLIHTFDPQTNEITLANLRSEERVKSVWLKLWLVTPGGYPAAPHGTPFDADDWATVASSDGDADVVAPTAAAWKKAPGAPNLTIFYQTWTITPQPSGEVIDLSNILDNVNGAAIRTIETKTTCTPANIPAPGGASLLALGAVACARRRR